MPFSLSCLVADYVGQKPPGSNVEHVQRRDDQWAIIDLFGKGGHVRSEPVPDWVKAAVDDLA